MIPNIMNDSQNRYKVNETFLLAELDRQVNGPSNNPRMTASSLVMKFIDLFIPAKKREKTVYEG